MKSLLVSQFSYQLSTNSFSAEENFRRDVLVKYSYFQDVAVTVSD